MKVLIKGIPASSGIAQGRARVILPGSKEKLKSGEILVAYITDASMFVDIMANAKAVVTDKGGITSHPAIVSRELGLPCIVATKNATKVIKTGMKIVVDGGKGVVYKLLRPKVRSGSKIRPSLFSHLEVSRFKNEQS